MTRQHLSDNKIIEGFRRGDSDIIQEYFYGYCRMGYFIFDQKYHIKESVETEKDMDKKRTTPEFIASLQPNEIFVFGSNLKGMHGGGAAYIAYNTL